MLVARNHATLKVLDMVEVHCVIEEVLLHDKLPLKNALFLSEAPEDAGWAQLQGVCGIFVGV